MDKTLKTRFLAFGSRPLVIILAVFWLGTAVYLPTLNYDFVWDDLIIIKENTRLKSLSNLPGFLFSSVPIDKNSAYYRPLFMFSFTLDYAFYKENPGGYHLTNTLLHGLNSALVSYSALLLFQNPYGALIAGALFALHPAHPEAVAWIDGRVDLLAALFSLLAVIFSLKKSERFKNLNARLWAPLCFFLALLSKETAVVILLPMFLGLYQQHREEVKRFKGAILNIIPSVLTLLFYLLLRSQVMKTSMLPKAKFLSSPFFLPELFLRYLSFLIFPFQRVSYFHYVPRPYPAPYPLDAKFWLLAGLTALVLGTITYLIYKKPSTAFSFSLLLLPCLPPLLFSLYINIIMMDRYLYMPSIGLVLLITWGFLQIPDKRKLGAGLGILLLLMAYGGIALWRTPLWKNDLSFAEALKKEYPSSPYIRAYLGRSYMDQNRLGEAYGELSLAVRQEPQDPRYHNELGAVLLRLDVPAMARAEFTESLRLTPDNGPALLGLGFTYAQEGDYDTALKYLDKAIAADPHNEVFIKNKEMLLARKQALKK